MHADRPPTRRVLAALLTLAAIVAPTGCGDDDPVRVTGSEVRVTLDEYAITPQVVSVREGRIELVARNAGRLTHNLRVEVPPDTPDDQAEALATTPTAQPGETVRTTVTLAKGRYRLRCTLANHDDLGEYGMLVVRPRGRT
jgi:uncharacterized cupredoxin-like copper-binding protein